MVNLHTCMAWPSLTSHTKACSTSVYMRWEIFSICIQYHVCNSLWKHWHCNRNVSDTTGALCYLAFGCITTDESIDIAPFMICLSYRYIQWIHTLDTCCQNIYMYCTIFNINEILIYFFSPVSMSICKLYIFIYNITFT